MYSLRDFGAMMADPGRFGAYRDAIAAAVRPGDSVAEIGCGAGIFSLLACKAGARRVFAIESEDTIQFARELAAANGFSDIIEFFQSDSRMTELPERVNVILSDIRGVMPLFDHVIPSLEDARQRFLAAGGIMIPQRDTLSAAIVEADDFYNSLTSPWRNSVAGVDLSPSLQPLLNEFYSVLFKQEQLLTPAQEWEVLDYTVGAAKRVSAELDFNATRNCTAHGICLWFDATLFERIGFTSAPGAPNSVYGQLFLPWLESVPLQNGQNIHVNLHADLVGKEYVWRWETRIPGAGGTPELCFQQSSFQGANCSPLSLRRKSANYVPVLSEIGRADLLMLERMDGSTSLQGIAQLAAEQYPHLFSSWNEALQRAAKLSSELSR